MKKEELELLTRKELQQIAKNNNLKANKKTIEIINELLEIYQKEQQEEEEEEEVTQVQQQLKEEEQQEESLKDTQTKQKEIQNEVQKESKKVIFDINSLLISNHIQFYYNLNICNGIIKRLNKLSVRVILSDGNEITIQKSDIIGLYSNDEVKIEVINENKSSIIEPESISFIQTIETVPQTETIVEQSEEIKQIETIDDSKMEIPLIQSHVNEIRVEPNSKIEEIVEFIRSPSPLPEEYCHDNLESTEDTELMTIEELEEQENESNNKNTDFEPTYESTYESEVENTIPIPTEKIVDDEQDFRRSTFIFNEQPLVLFPMTPSSKTNMKRKSLIKSTKAQRVRAEAIALKQERLSLAANNINQLAFPPKSPHVSQITLLPKSPHLQKHISHERFSVTNRSVSAPRLFSQKKDVKQNVKSHQPNLHSSTHSHSNTSNSKPQQPKSNVPNFDKLHEQAFKKQKSITSVVKENKKVQEKMTVAMKEALQTKSPAIIQRLPIHIPKRESNVSMNPFQSIVSQNDENIPTNVNKPTNNKNNNSQKPLKRESISETRKDEKRNKFHKDKKSLREKQMNISRGVISK